MTDTYASKKYKIKKKIGNFLLGASVTVLFVISLLLSNEISVYFIDGLNLSIKVIIPSVFPFLLLTDLFITTVHLDKITPARNFFEKMFNISGNAISAFICGFLCGFPIGAKMSINFYKNGIISKCECERLMSFSNNASPAYVIFVIGLAFRGNIKDGILLYFIMAFSAFLTGLIIGISKKKTNNKGFIIKQNYSFVSSIRQSADVCINICSFICTFAIICGLTKKFICNKLVCALVISLFEIGNASVYLSKLCNDLRLLSFVLTSFAISFSGISVIAQTICISGTNNTLSVFNHVKYKFIQGIISAFLAFLFFSISQ